MGAIYHCGEQDVLIYIGYQLDKASCVSDYSGAYKKVKTKAFIPEFSRK